MEEWMCAERPEYGLSETKTYEGPGGGGRGVTSVFRGGGGYIRSLSKFEYTPKSLISGQKKHPYFLKTLTFSSK